MYSFQVRTIIERTLSNLFDTVRDCYTSKSTTVTKRKRFNACNTIGDCYALKAATISKCIYINGFYTARDCYTGKSDATPECKISNACYAVRNFHACKIVTFIKSAITNAGNFVSHTFISYFLGYCYITFVITIITSFTQTLISHLNCFVFGTFNFIIDAAVLKAVGACNCCTQQ